jgi:hypothetical protein
LDPDAVSKLLDCFNRVFPSGENRSIPSSQTIRDVFRTEPDADAQLKGLLDSLGARRTKVLAVKGVETIAQFVSSPEQSKQLKRLLRSYEFLSPSAKPSCRWQHFDALLEYLEILRAKINQGSPRNRPHLPKSAISLALFPVCWSTIGRVIDFSEKDEKAFKRFEELVVQRMKRRHRSTMRKLTTNPTTIAKRRGKGRSFHRVPPKKKP